MDCSGIISQFCSQGGIFTDNDLLRVGTTAGNERIQDPGTGEIAGANLMHLLWLLFLSPGDIGSRVFDCEWRQSHRLTKPQHHTAGIVDHRCKALPREVVNADTPARISSKEARMIELISNVPKNILLPLTVPLVAFMTAVPALAEPIRVQNLNPRMPPRTIALEEV